FLLFWALSLVGFLAIRVAPINSWFLAIETVARNTLLMAFGLSFLKHAMVLWSGFKLPRSQICSILRSIPIPNAWKNGFCLNIHRCKALINRRDYRADVLVLLWY